MENTITQVKLQPKPLIVSAPVVSKPIEKVSFSSQQLLNALYYIWDAFDRANVPFFLVGQTARDVKAQHNLKGDHVAIGIRQVEWVSGGRRIIDAFAYPLTENEHEVMYNFEGVPIILHVYSPDHECIVQTDMVRYKYEEFKIPNPLNIFEEVYG